MENRILSPEEHIFAVLDNHHRATATKDVGLLKACFVSWGQFVGTDDSEVWTSEEYAKFLEDTESGWDMMECLARSVCTVVTDNPPTSTFFEIVRHAQYGVMRGSGIVIEHDHQWKIVQYVLSFSVPNHVVDNTNLLELLARSEPPTTEEISAMCEIPG